jgi:hypothetical protein
MTIGGLCYRQSSSLYKWKKDFLGEKYEVEVAKDSITAIAAIIL